MKLNDMTMYLLGEYLIDSADNLNEFYHDSMELLRGVANEKKIEFDEYYKTRWEKSADTIVNFNEVYFSAQVDDDLFEYLNCVWNIINKENLSAEILKERVQILISKERDFKKKSIIIDRLV